MCTSQQSRKKDPAAVTGYIYLIVALLCAGFGAGYEHFGHGVYSNFMLYAFLFPLIGGTAVFDTIALFRLRMPGRLALNLYNSGIAAWTFGALFTGALKIYGTTNSLTVVYWIAGGLFVLAGIGKYCADIMKKQKH